MAYRTSERLSENIYKFTAEASDNKAVLRCEANNIMAKAPLKTEVVLSVLCKYRCYVLGSGERCRKRHLLIGRDSRIPKDSSFTFNFREF